MRAAIGCAAVLFALAGFVTNVAANENAAGVAEKRGQPPVVAQAGQAQEPAKTDRTIGVCHLVNSLGGIAHRNPQSPIYVISPSETVRHYLGAFEKKFISYEKEIKVTLLQGPEQGELKVKANGNYRYIPINGYVGADRATLLVEIGDLKVKAVYHFKVMDGGASGSAQGDPQSDKKNCPNGEMWQISTTSNAKGVNQ